MKIVFVEPITDFIPVRHGFYCPSNAILDLAAYLEQYKYDIRIIDPYILSLNWKGVLNQVKEENPKVVGISGYTYKAYNCMATAKLIKEYFPKITIILGGIHFSAMPEESLNICRSIDYIVIGEGEVTLLELIRKLEDGKKKEDLIKVKGLAYMLDGEFIKTPPRPFIEDIDSLPMPAYHLLPLNNRKVPLAWRNTIGCTFSRGCIYRCKFCSSSEHWKGTVRRKSAQRIGDEIELLVKQYNKSAFVFGDDDFMCNKKENIKFLEELERRKLNIRYVVRTRIDDIIKNRDLLERFKNSGLISVALGIERFQQKYISKWEKGYNVQDIESAVHYLEEVKVPLIELYLIFGVADDDKNAWRNTIAKIKKLNQPIFFISFFTPLPGTQILKEQYSNIKIWDYGKYDFMHAIMPTQHMSISEMENLVWKTFFLWWLMPTRFINSLTNIYRFKFYLFRLLIHVRGLYKFIQFLIRKAVGKKEDRYVLTIKKFYQGHVQYIGKEIGEENSFSLWRRRWGFKI